MDTEMIKEMAECVNNVVLATAKPYQEQIQKLRDAINLVLNENFSGQSTLSPYAKRQLKQALQG